MKIKEVEENAKTFFGKFDAKFQISDKKNFKDNLIPFFLL